MNLRYSDLTSFHQRSAYSRRKQLIMFTITISQKIPSNNTINKHICSILGLHNNTIKSAITEIAGAGGVVNTFSLLHLREENVVAFF